MDQGEAESEGMRDLEKTGCTFFFALQSPGGCGSDAGMPDNGRWM